MHDIRVRPLGAIGFAVGMAAIALIGAGFSAGAEGSETSGNDSTAGAQLYQAACASCHGADGQGTPHSMVGFDTPLPDFADCNFASREPNADWGAIIHSGGPVRAFDRMMPAFGEALSDAEIDLVLEHVRTFCPEKTWPPGDLNLPRALVTEKAFPEDEAVFTTSIAAEGDGAIQNKIVYERRFGARNQMEVIVPFGWEERRVPAAGPGGGPETDWVSGVGDIALGVKRAVWHNAGRGAIFSVAGEVILPTGDEDKGFGSGVFKLEPFLAFGKILPADSFLQIQVGAEIPLEDGPDDEGFWRLVLGKTVTEGRIGRAWSPMIELLGAQDLVSGAETHWDLVPQFQVTLNQRQHVMANLGVRIPLDNTDVRDTKILAYVLWDWFDGGLFDGW